MSNHLLLICLLRLPSTVTFLFCPTDQFCLLGRRARARVCTCSRSWCTAYHRTSTSRLLWTSPPRPVPIRHR